VRQLSVLASYYRFSASDISGFSTRYRTVIFETCPQYATGTSMITEQALSSSVNSFEHLIEHVLHLHLSTALNISANGPSRTTADELNGIDVTGTSLGNAGWAGTSAAGAA
jgi:hypothetical protein